ncbi:unnamed protein product [Rotaria sordida]|uniref:NADH dehydrogenase [ubiquinone] flavoprotein 3, mitochondrial n=1 Tax=Rotaria sordida TaxID=392033 RepID=A0A818W508_9BILA|nr:unnamed protein product [Rotaria sordida]CAF1012527.1 unnamed protein product [Rotaria sordida]CAF1057776.1 unnamed protein product [Rotaria sordida]CAF1118266.1 unnamed protein product [Rotaria sordida]CAF3712938.1 unnamed protein product [Rotaria sordida]
MISNKIFRSSSILSRIYYHQFVPVLSRSGSISTKESSSSQNKSPSKEHSDVKYYAADMYNYTIFSYYDIETSMTKYRLPQPSSYVPFKPESNPQKK